MASATLGLLRPRHIDSLLEPVDVDLDDQFSEDEGEQVQEREDNSACRLLSLPAEIRNQIYKFLLTSPKVAELQLLMARKSIQSCVLPVWPAVLNTCRQIYEEASPIFWSRNTFIASPTLLNRIAFLIEPKRPICCPKTCKKIRRWHVSVRLDCDAQYTEQQATDAFTGVEELEIDANQAMYKSSGMGNLLLFKMVRGVKKARVTGSIERDFAEWLQNCMMSPVGTKCDDFDDGAVTIRIGDNVEEYNVWTHGNR